MNKYLWIFIISIFPLQLLAQGHKIDVHIKDLPGETVYLAHHFANNKRILADDTLVLNNQGKGIIEGKKSLKGGMYMIFFPNRSYFDFLVGDDQHFAMSTTQENPVEDASFSGSAINSAFLDYRKFIVEQRQKMKKARKEKKSAKESGDDEAMKSANAQIEQINNEVNEKRNNLAEKHQGTFLETFLNATSEIEVPDPPKDAEGNITDSLFQYRYYKNNYFSNFDVGNPRLLRTTLYENKMMNYVKNVVMQHPDTLVKETEKLVEASMHDRELFRYVLGTLYNYYNKSKVMGMDKVFVNLADYYISGKADWNDSSFVADLEERVAKMKNTFIGDKARDFMAPTANERHIRLHEIEAPYTVLYFYDPECGHCKEETPVLKKISDKYIEQGVEFVGFYTQVEPEKWKNYIDKEELHRWINVWDPYNKTNFRFNYHIYSTPTIYVLNQNKEIIAKRISAEQTGEILKEELKTN